LYVETILPVGGSVTSWLNSWK